MKNVIMLLFILSCFGMSGQADIPMDWNVSLTEGGRIGVYHPLKEDGYTARISIEYNGKQYNHKLDVEPSEWGFADFPKDFDFDYTDIPEGTGAMYINLKVDVDSEVIYEDQVFLTRRNSNQAYEVNISEIADRINLYGAIIDDCIFWHDYKGFNYVVRSHNEGKGIFLAHWVMDVSGGTERFGYYKSQSGCASKELIQQHSIGWALEDANNDGYMEFYSLVVDGCSSNKLLPTNARLYVFTNLLNLSLEGRTYNLMKDATDYGGDFEVSKKLEEYPQILKQAEEAWEMYIME